MPASCGMAGSGRFLASIQDKSIHLPVFEKMLKGNVSFEHFMFLIVLLSRQNQHCPKISIMRLQGGKQLLLELRTIIGVSIFLK
ncbi:hypothetical protein ACIP97_05575 [Peribacillus frigoritolerans]|uniref:hypothetical protein n=1 Tax=Peribacillus frigoritolerans TaxID=450367 RepID=UPI0037FF0D89